MRNQLLLIAFYGCMYATFHWWTDNTVRGKQLKHFLQNWKADGWVHGIMCAVSVWLLSVCAILAVGLSFRFFGL